MHLIRLRRTHGRDLLFLRQVLVSNFKYISKMVFRLRYGNFRVIRP